MIIKNNARNGALISIGLIVIALVIILIVISAPKKQIDVVDITNKLKYNVSSTETENSTREIICYIVVGIILVMAMIINLVMCRCNYCGSHIRYMNIFTMYCPYCGKSIDATKE